MPFDPAVSFYTDTSPLSAAYKRLYVALVPDVGKCDTIEGELLRASSRIYHDYYCNGFGNNWSGAFKFLDTHLGLKAGERKLLGKYARGKICKRTSGMYTADDRIAAALEELSNRVVMHIVNVERSGAGFKHTMEDMFDYQEKSAY